MVSNVSSSLQTITFNSMRECMLTNSVLAVKSMDREILYKCKLFLDLVLFSHLLVVFAVCGIVDYSYYPKYRCLEIEPEKVFSQSLYIRLKKMPKLLLHYFIYNVFHDARLLYACLFQLHQLLLHAVWRMNLSVKFAS